jgi:murein DD-endopeptidase MepM/ murein hydrolase activator NlpD
MSYRQVAYPHRADSGRYVDPRQRHRARGGDYTLAHAGRQVQLGPVAFWIVVGTLVVMAGWSVLTGTYFAFHDDVLKRLIARQAEMQFAYEDRIAELRAQVDRIASRQLLDQEQFEQKLDRLLKRQATLESRAAVLAGSPDVATTGSIKRTPELRAAPKPSPISDTIIFSAPPDREARLESRNVAALDGRAPAQRLRGGIDGALARLSQSLDKVETQQFAALNTMEENYDARLRRMRGVLTDLGIDAVKVPQAPAASGVGGPLIALPGRSDETNFERQLQRINLTRSHVDRLTRTLASVPVRKPVFGEIDMSSPFGMRMDPFVKGPAIHTGIDMRGDIGDAVRATANGTVVTAGWNGGYGKMVEIEHGFGLSTRYGHLSEIDVKVGQSVKLGQIIGKIGSTGRSTGPHLHYETRVDGDAVDPQKFLRAGLRLGAQ